MKTVGGVIVCLMILMLMVTMQTYHLEKERSFQELGRRVWQAGYEQGIQQQRANVVPRRDEDSPTYRSYTPPGNEPLPYELPHGLIYNAERRERVIRNYRLAKYELWRYVTGN